MTAESRATTSNIRVTPDAHAAVQRAALSAALATGKRVSMSVILTAMAEVSRAHQQEFDSAIQALMEPDTEAR